MSKSNFMLGKKSDIPADNDATTHRTMVNYWNSLLITYHEEKVPLKHGQLRDELNRVRAYIDSEKGKHLSYEVLNIGSV